MPQPQVTVIHQKFDAVFLGRDWIFALQCGDGREMTEHAEFNAARRALVGPHDADDANALLLPQPLGRLEDLFGHVGPEHRGLHEAAAVAQLEELQLALAALVGQPGVEHHFLVKMVFQFSNGCHDGSV